MKFIGYASVFNNLDAHKDIVSRGAFGHFNNCSAGSIKLLFNHDPNFEIGRITSIIQDGRGLLVSGEVFDRSVVQMVRSNGVNGLSIGYIPQLAFNPMLSKNERRILAKVQLNEISIVKYPSNPMARLRVI